MIIRINYDNLILAMAKACCSYADLEKKAGISGSTIARIKKGQQTPNIKTIGKIARALGISPSEIMHIEQEEK